jgi:hypothetical protein
MSIENKIRAFAGTVILASVALTHYHSPNWVWLTVFVGANLLQSSMTKFCPLENILKYMAKGSAAQAPK